MASGSEDDVFDNIHSKLRKDNAKDAEERARIQNEKALRRAFETLNANSELPVTVSSVQILQAKNTRRSFLENIVNPLVHAHRDGPITLSQLLAEVTGTITKLERLDIFKSPISVYIDKANLSDQLTTSSDLAIFFNAKEKSRYTITTGTEAGHAEGSAYANVALRNIFGGAESLNAHASFGTRTKSSYSATFESPLLGNPNLLFELSGLASSTAKGWASHEEASKGGLAKLKWLTEGGQRHELCFSGIWRQIMKLSPTASTTVRADAGDSFKSSVTHTWMYDRRDHLLLPTRGYLLKTTTELAGLGHLGGDVAFSKIEAEGQTAIPLSIPQVMKVNGFTIHAGIRTGVLYPLSLGNGNKPCLSRINDRFQLGGPTDVRGFRLSGLGPRDGSDAIGGDLYAAGGLSLLFPLPRVAPTTPLRIQAFINGGRLVAMTGTGKKESMNGEQTAESFKRALLELRSGLPSFAAGLGLVYAHPAARFELNLSLPLVLRKGEEGRKGLSFGVGVSFL